MRVTVKLLPKPPSKVNLNQAASMLEILAANAVAENLYQQWQRKCSGLRCAEHSSANNYFEIVAVKGKAPKINQQLCCRAFADQVAQKIK